MILSYEDNNCEKCKEDKDEDSDQEPTFDIIAFLQDNIGIFVIIGLIGIAIIFYIKLK